jgi:hypothetical protein
VLRSLPRVLARPARGERALADPRDRLEIRVTQQTIPSSRRPTEDFVSAIRVEVDAMSEMIVALAKVPPPAFSVTLAAGTPFDAYLLISRLVENATDLVHIVDAYADESLFSRYLLRVKDGVQVSIRTSPSASGPRRAGRSSLNKPRLCSPLSIRTTTAKTAGTCTPAISSPRRAVGGLMAVSRTSPFPRTVRYTPSRRKSARRS